MKRPLLVLLTLVAFGLRVHQLDDFSFWQDEGLTPLRAGYSITEILSNEVTIQEGVTQDTHPPLYFLLIHFGRQIFGLSDFAYRYPSVIAGVLLIPLLFQFGRQLSDRRVGAAAALLGTFNPLFVWYSQEARMYTWLVLFATAASYVLWRALTGEKILRWLSLYILFASLAFVTHYTTVFLIAFQTILWGWLLWKRGRRRLIIVAAVLGLLVLIPFIPYTLPRFFSEAENNYYYVSPLIMLQDVVHGFGMGFTTQFSQWSIRFLDVFAAIVLILGIVGSYRISRNWLLPIFLSGTLLAVVIGLALGSLIKPMYLGMRHIIAGSSAFILLLSIGAVIIPRRSRWLSPAMLAVLILGPLISLNNLYNNPHFAKDEVRGLIVYVEDRAGDRDLVIYNNPILLPFHWHYQERDDLVATALPVYPNPADESTIDQLREFSNSYERIWFIKDPPPDTLDDSRLVDSWLSDNLQLIDKHNTRARTMVLQVDGYSTLPQVTSNLPEDAAALSAPEGAAPKLSGVRTSFDQPAALPTLWIDLYWDLEAEVEDSNQLRFTIEDANSQVWLDESQPPLKGNRLISPVEGLHRFSYGLEIPNGLPPGEYDLFVQQWDEDSGRELSNQLSLGSVVFDSSNMWPGSTALEFDTSDSIEFENGYHLLGLQNISVEVRPGHSLPIFLFWQSSSFDPEVLFDLEVVGPDGAVWDSFSSPPGPDWLTAGAWVEDAAIRELVGISFPADAPPGKYRLHWRLVDYDGSIPGRTKWRPWSSEWLTLGAVELHPWPQITSQPSVETLVNAEFGSDYLLVGFDLPATSVHPGDILDLTQYWQAVNKPADDLFVFVHLISPEDGTIVSQLDRIPANWLRPTSGWRPGEYIVDEYRLPIPPDLAPGTYHLYTGLFDPETMARQPLIVDGVVFPEERFQLPSILVEP